MARIAVTIQLDEAVLAQLRRAAAADDVSLGQGGALAIDRDLPRRDKMKRAVRANERLVAPLRSLLADDLAFATIPAGGWRARVSLREARGGLILLRLPGETRVCKTAELGRSRARLAGPPGAPFPGHAYALRVTGQIAD